MLCTPAAHVWRHVRKCGRGGECAGLTGVVDYGTAYTEGSLSFISCPRRDASQPAAKIGRRKYKTYISFWCVYVHAMFFGNSH